MSKLRKILAIRRELKELGDYDHSISGVIGEIYAEEILGIKKAPKGTKGYDGIINGKKVQIKTKDGKQRADSGHYAQIDPEHLKIYPDLLIVMVLVDKNGEPYCHGPVPLSAMEPSIHKQGLRYSLKKIKLAETQLTKKDQN
jgi:hypothetical protein